MMTVRCSNPAKHGLIMEVGVLGFALGGLALEASRISLPIWGLVLHLFTIS